MNFLEKLDFLMKEQGLNKHSLASASKIPYTTIHGWYEKGYEGLKLTTLRKLSDYFGVSLDFWVKDIAACKTHDMLRRRALMRVETLSDNQIKAVLAFIDSLDKMGMGKS